MSSLDDRFSSGPIADAVAAQVEELMHQARQSAERIQDEVETATAQRALEVRAAADADAQRIREDARVDAERYLEQRRAEVDLMAAERIKRLRALTDDIVARGEVLVSRIDEADSLRRKLDDLLRAITAAVQATAAEAARPLGGISGSSSEALDLRREMQDVPPGPGQSRRP